MARLNMVEAIDQALQQEMERDPKMVVLGEDVGRDGGVFRVTDGLIQRFGEERVIDTPLAESGIVGMAIGMAIAGYHPVAEIQFSGFAYPAYDQLVCHAARMRNRSRGEFTVPLVVRMPYGGGIRALEHHSESMEAVFAHVPGLKVVIPADPYEAKGLLTAALCATPTRWCSSSRPGSTGPSRPRCPRSPTRIPLGKARVVQEGATSPSSPGAPRCGRSRRPPSRLEAEGVADAEVIDVRTLSPFDFETVDRQRDQDRPGGHRARGAHGRAGSGRRSRPRSWSGRCCTSRRRWCGSPASTPCRRWPSWRTTISRMRTMVVDAVKSLMRVLRGAGSPAGRGASDVEYEEFLELVKGRRTLRAIKPDPMPGRAGREAAGGRPLGADRLQHAAASSCWW